MEGLILPPRIEEKLKALAEREGRTPDEVVIEALDKTFGLLDPDERADVHWELCERYLEEARRLLSEGDFVQASEKAWGAAAQALKAVAAREGRELRSHGELWRFASELRGRMGDEELGALWHTANALHINFYENWMPPEEVRLDIERVGRFVEKLKAIAGR